MRRTLALLLASGLTLLGVVPAASAAPHRRLDAAAGGTYSVGAAVESINPSQAMIDSQRFYLGGFGLSNGEVAGQPGGIEDPRYATHILGDGTHAIALSQLEVQGYFVAYKQGNYGLVDIRREAARRIAVLRATQGGPAMDAGAILVDSNHTHGGPDTAGVWGGVPTEYLQLCFEQSVQAIVEAWQALRPVVLRYGVAKAGVAGYNDGVADQLQTNQFSNDPNNVSVDDELRVLQATDRDTGAVVATYANFSAHADVLGGSNRGVTGDYTGPVSDLLSGLGGTGFIQVATLGRQQPNRGGCANQGSDDATNLCSLNAYAARVFARAQQALASAQEITGTPIVELHSYLMTDLATNAPIYSLNYGGFVVGAPIYRATTPPWGNGPALGSPSFSGRIGSVLLSGGPGEMYPQIVLKVRELVAGKMGYLSLGTAGDFLGYIIAPYEAYPEPIRRSIESGNPPGQPSDCSGVPSPAGCPSPISNDNYFFNVSHTFGERLTCSLLRGASESFPEDGKDYAALYTDQGVPMCPPFANDLAFPKNYDTQFSSTPTDIAADPVVPEAPIAALLPVFAVTLLGGALLILRRRRWSA